MTTLATPYELPINPTGRRNPGWWAMVWIIATEATLFAFLLASYFYLGSMAKIPWPPTGEPELTLVLPNTLILLASSVTMWWGAKGLERGSHTRLRIGLAVTFVLGVTFLVIQGVEYSRKPFTMQDNAYGSLFFTITGFHGAHVMVGLLMNVVIQVREWVGHFTSERHLAVTNAGMYWHFVDAVWLVVFASLYLTPYWS